MVLIFIFVLWLDNIYYDIVFVSTVFLLLLQHHQHIRLGPELSCSSSRQLFHNEIYFITNQKQIATSSLSSCPEITAAHRVWTCKWGADCSSSACPTSSGHLYRSRKTWSCPPSSTSYSNYRWDAVIDSRLCLKDDKESSLSEVYSVWGKTMGLPGTEG